MTQTNLIWCPISCAFTNNQKNGQKSTGPSYPCAKKCTFCDENIYLTKIFRKITHKPPRKWIPCSKLERKQVKKFTIKSPLLQQKMLPLCRVSAAIGKKSKKQLVLVSFFETTN